MHKNNAYVLHICYACAEAADRNNVAWPVANSQFYAYNASTVMQRSSAQL